MKIQPKENLEAQNELELIIQLNHPNIVRFYDHFELVTVNSPIEIKLCIVIEFCQVLTKLTTFFLLLFYYITLF